MDTGARPRAQFKHTAPQILHPRKGERVLVGAVNPGSQQVQFSHSNVLPARLWRAKR